MAGDRQLDLFEVIADIDAGLEGLPGRAPGWRKVKPSLFGEPEGVVYVLNSTPDGGVREYTQVVFAYPEGWTVQANEAGTAYFETDAGELVLCDEAVRTGRVKVSDVSPFVDRTVGKGERWSGR